jgi:hypothetical protein
MDTNDTEYSLPPEVQRILQRPKSTPPPPPPSGLQVLGFLVGLVLVPIALYQLGKFWGRQAALTPIFVIAGFPCGVGLGGGMMHKTRGWVRASRPLRVAMGIIGLSLCGVDLMVSAGYDPVEVVRGLADSSTESQPHPPAPPIVTAKPKAPVQGKPARR